MTWLRSLDWIGALRALLVILCALAYGLACYAVFVVWTLS